MLALAKVQKQILDDSNGKALGVKTFGIGISDVEWYDHQRTQALQLSKKYPIDGKKLPNWHWIVVREDGKRIRFRCSHTDPSRSFTSLEWPFDKKEEWIQPPSTGPGKDSKRKVDGRHYFQNVAAQFGKGTSGKGGKGKEETRGSGGDVPMVDDTRGSGGNSGDHARGSGSGGAPQPTPGTPAAVADDTVQNGGSSWTHWGRDGDWWAGGWGHCDWGHRGGQWNWGQSGWGQRSW